MRNFTFLFFFMLIGAITFAQQPVVTPVWDNSVYGNADWSSGIPIGGEAPDWMGGTSERGMTHFDGKLYVVSRKAEQPEVVVLDAATGNLLESMPIDTSVVKGGTFAVNDISITPSGKILVANLATNTHTQPFKVYMLEEDGEGGLDATVLLEWNSRDTIDGVEQPFYRLGDGFAFYGDISEEEDGYIIAGDANTGTETGDPEPIVFRWDVQAGVAVEEPVKIALQEVYPAPIGDAPAKLGITPRIWPLDNDFFWADGHSTYPALYNMQGELISTFTGDVKPVTTGISGVSFFSFKELDFILAPTTNHVTEPPAAFQLFLIPEAGAEEADSVTIFPERGLGKNTNGSYAAPLAVDIQEDMVLMYIMSPNNGIAAFKLTVEEDPSSIDLTEKSDDHFKVYPNPATDRVFVKVNKPTQVAIYNLAGSMVKSRLVESQNDFINVSDLQSGMYLIKSQFTNDFTQKLIVR